MNLQEHIRKVLKEELNEVRVPRSERVELYKDDNIIVVVPLTHRALQKYAHQCQWCINDDIYEWEDYHKGKHAVIIQRNPKKPKIGITGNPTASEIFLLAKWDNNQSSFEGVCQMLDYEFRNDRTMSDYYVTISNDMNNFATNIVYYSPETGIYDQEDNFLWNFNIEINDIPNVKPKVIEIMDDYLQENEEMSLQESIKRTLNEESLRQTLMDEIERSGIKDTANLMTVHVGELLHMVGIKGTQEDMLFLAKVIMKNEVKEQLKYCSYQIVPTLHSFNLYVIIPKPLPEDEGVWSRDQRVREEAKELIEQLLYNLGGGLIRGHYVHISNTGDC
jgi:hypothetical protein